MSSENTGERPGFVPRLKAKASKIKKELVAVYYAYQNPRLPLLPKIIIAIALGYALSPIDLIPDFIPVLGFIDDVLIVPGLISLGTKMIPPDIMTDARKRAEREPLNLKKSWKAAAVLTAVWLIILTAFASLALKL